MQYVLHQTAEEASWLIGEGVLTSRVHGKAIRSMAAPGTAYDDPILGRDPQPAHMDDYVVTREDHGGVHINSGILNHAFFRAATFLGGYVWPVLGLIWYLTMLHDLMSVTTFRQFADATTLRAVTLYGAGHAVPRAIAYAWGAVGLPPSPAIRRLSR
jgi:Zn-dependent metalloprotease